jgi:pyridoxine 5-phosphate synthase
MTLLSVNVNKLATLRNSRGGNVPDVVALSKDILSYGAHGITVHPRPDERHIRRQDVKDLSMLIQEWNAHHPDKPAEFNIEGYPDPGYLELLSSVKFDQATLVPDPPHVLTSNAGWKLHQNIEFLRSVTSKIKTMGSPRVSLFVDPFAWSANELAALKNIGADRIELYTEAYAKSFATAEFSQVLQKYQTVADEVHTAGYAINAGHDLDHLNLAALVRGLPNLAEVSIGHALISQSLYWGLQKTIAAYLKAIRDGSSLT